MNTIFLISMPGGMEWVIIAIVVILLFGAKKIPELARGLGRGIREFKDASKQVKDEIKEGIKEDQKAEAEKTASPSERKDSDSNAG